jgi:hypothetical protein
LPNFIGRIWHVHAFIFLAVLLRWQELWHGRRLEVGISSNKAIFPFSWRLLVLVLRCSVGWLSEMFFVKL